MIINGVIEWAAENELILFLTKAFFVAGFIAVLIYDVIMHKKYNISMMKSLIFIILAYTISVTWTFVQCWIENGFTGWGGNNIVRTFVWIPLVVWLVGKPLKIEWARGCDFVAPCVPLIQAVSHWGCIFPGCCHGYPFKWGIYNIPLETKVFPCQPLEALVALAIVIIICRYEKKQNYSPTGLAYPLMLMMFGYSRFLLEFLRDNEKIVLGISNLAFHALFMAFVGTAVYMTMKEKMQAAQNKNIKKKRKV